jgi:hypothetical protein
MIRKFVLLVVIASTVASCQKANAILYGVSDGDPGNLYRISEVTGEAILVAPVLPGAVSLTGASFLGGELFATDVFGAAELTGTIDTSSGTFTPTISQGFSSNWHGLASDESAGLLYTIDINDSEILKSITPAGVVTSIGTGAGIDGRGMAYDDLNDILYATSSFDSALYQVDTTTGVAQFIGGMGIDAGNIGLAYDEDTQTLYANDGAISQSLYRVDINSGLATLIGSNLVNVQINGLAWIAVPEPMTGAICVIGTLATVCLRTPRRRR